MSYYRRSAVLAVGGFNEKLNVFEILDVQWNLEKAGYKLGYSKNVVHLHHRAIHRFKFRFILRNAFNFGHEWHRLHHIHPDKTGISAMPVKTAAFVTLVFISYFYPPTLWVLFMSMLLWWAFRTYRDRARVKNCIAHMEGIPEKIAALTLGFLAHILFDIAHELGKLFSFISS